MKSSGEKRICVIGAGPGGLTALKNFLQAGCRDRDRDRTDEGERTPTGNVGRVCLRSAL
jgi:cation diffusion facilitator CzcD-associated flavoprotein CzcO